MWGRFNEWDQKLLLSPKLIYFWVGSLFYAFSIFRIDFCRKYLGLNTAEAGDVAAAMSLFGFLFATVWSSLADRFQRHRTVLILLSAMAAASFQLLMVPLPQNWRFIYSLGVFSIFGAMIGGLLPMADYLVLNLLTEKFGVSQTLYGRQRMMGTISYGFTTLFIGAMMDLWGVTVLFGLLPLFAIVLIFRLLVLALPDRPRHQPINIANSKKADAAAAAAAKELDNSIPVKKPSMMVFVRSFDFMFFLVTVFVTGCGRQVLQVFLSPFLKANLNMTNTEAGLAVVCSTIFSVFFLFMGPTLMSRLGVQWMLLVGMVTMGVRLGCYVYLPHRHNWSWAVYGIELLNGVTFSFTHLAGVKIAADFAPTGLEATSQAIYTSFYMQLPAVVMAFGGGRLYHKWGAVFLFWCSTIVTLVMSVIVFIKFCLCGELRRATP